jgi:hypothetical protein
VAVDPHAVLRNAVIEAQRTCKTTISRLLGVLDGPDVGNAIAATTEPPVA